MFTTESSTRHVNRCYSYTGNTLSALYTLGCPMPAFAAVAARKMPSSSPPSLALEVPPPSLHGVPELANMSQRVPRQVLRWYNFWHAADPLAYPMVASLPQESVTDVRVKLGGAEWCVPRFPPLLTYTPLTNPTPPHPGPDFAPLPLLDPPVACPDSAVGRSTI